MNADLYTEFCPAVLGFCEVHKQIDDDKCKWGRLTWNFIILVEPAVMDSKRL